jgi:hypothetical protein
MARIRISTRSGQPLSTLGSRVIDEYKRRAQAAGDEAMSELQAAAIETLSQPGHGRTYKRGEIVHRASAPGEPPATDTGTARRTVGWVTDGALRWRFGAGSIVLLWLERGTRFILPRPWIWQSIRRALPKMRAAIRRRLGDG